MEQNLYTCESCKKAYIKEAYYRKHISSCLKEIKKEKTIDLPEIFRDKKIVENLNQRFKSPAMLSVPKNFEAKENLLDDKEKPLKKTDIEEEKNKKFYDLYINLLENSKEKKPLKKEKKIFYKSEKDTEYSSNNESDYDIEISYEELCKQELKKFSDYDKFMIFFENIKIYGIKRKHLDNITQILKYERNSNYLISNILINPYKFINNSQLLISFQICEKIRKDEKIIIPKEDILNGYVIDFILDSVKNKTKSFYVKKWIFDKNLKEFCEKNGFYGYYEYIYDVQIIIKKINGEEYCTTKYLYEMEKKMTDIFLKIYLPDDLTIEYLNLDEKSKINTFIKEFENRKTQELSKVFKLTEKQKLAILNCINNRFQMIFGYPGTGKTTIVECVLYILDYLYPDYNFLNNTNFLAPTGLAAYNLKESCKSLNISPQNFSTIHKFKYSILKLSLYGYEDGIFKELKLITMELKSMSSTSEYNTKELCKKHLEQNEELKKIKKLQKKKKDLEKLLKLCKTRLIIIDELSMIDLFLFNDIIKCLEVLNKDKFCRLIFLGDKNQLPPISSGSAQSCFINSGIYNDTILYLKDIKRQDGALKNLILKINKEEVSLKDFDNETVIFIEYSKIFKNTIELDKKLEMDKKELKKITNFENRKKLSENIDKLKEQIKLSDTLYLLKEFIDKYQLNSSNSQFITPQKDFSAGYDNMNYILQKIYNPAGTLINLNRVSIFKVNDPVYRNQNNYEDDDTFRANGEVGIIKKYEEYECFLEDSDEENNSNGLTSVKKIKKEKVSKEKTKKISTIIIEHNNNPEDIEEVSINELYDEFGLNYCKTIHKVQGSQYDNVVILMSPSHNYMWTSNDSKNLFYTAVSRAKKRCFIIGTEDLLLKCQSSKQIERESVFLKESNEFSLDDY